MKGVILAGGLGSRLLPLTRVTNKHLLPVYDKPMIYYPIECLINAGIEDIMIVTGGDHAGDFLRLLGNGAAFGLRDLHYTYQEGEGGIADALRLAEHFADGDKVVVVLGDNIIEYNIRKAVGEFFAQGKGAKILLKEVHDPAAFRCGRDRRRPDRRHRRKTRRAQVQPGRDWDLHVRPPGVRHRPHAQAQQPR
jgi:glucose-1-phosphate thymidylyltransferase